MCLVAQWYLILCGPWAVTCQTPLAMAFSRQEYWSGLPFPTPGDFPDPGIKPTCLVYPYWLFSCSAVSDSLQPHKLQHAMLPCPLPSPGVYSGSCPLSWWYHPSMSSSVILFFICLQSFPLSGSFLMSWVFASGGQSIGASASASVLPGKPLKHPCLENLY